MQNGVRPRVIWGMCVMLAACTARNDGADVGEAPDSASATEGDASVGESSDDESASVGESSGDGGSTTDPSDGACGIEDLVQSKRLVRLTFNQQLNTLGQLFGHELAEQLASDFDIADGTHRTFPPLANPREGSLVTDNQFQTGDNIAQHVAEFVRDNFAAVTGCTEDAADPCARAYVLATAAQAFRRPVTQEDEAGLLGVYDAMLAEGGSIAEATQYGVYAILLSPHFVYRTEFGETPTAAGRLSPLELASALSYFLTDAAPDQELLDAAHRGDLDSVEGIREQVERLLATPEVRANLETAMFAYFQLGTLDTVVIDPARAPTFDNGMRNSMRYEVEAFLRNALWPGVLTALLTGRETLVNERLANVYGLEFPPPGTTPNEDGFAPVTLPEERAGLLTLAGFLTARSRPDEQSVVGRGLAVNAAFLCAENPPFPETLVPDIEAAEAMLHDQTEREKAEYRMETPTCAGCHIGFDPYGLALDQFGIIGAFREVDDEGRPIDASVTLPANAGGAYVANAAEMARALAETEAFNTCMAKNLLAYALAEGGASTRSCATQSIVEHFASTDGSFSSLVIEVALAEAFRERAADRGE